MIELNPQQKRIVAAGITVLAAFIVVAAIVALAVLTVRFFQAFNHVFLPLAVAAVAALVVEPWFKWLQEKAHLPIPLALTVLFISIAVPFAGAIWFFGTLAVSQFSGLIEQIPGWWQATEAWVEKNWPEFSRLFNEHPLGSQIRDSLQAPEGAAVDVVAALARGTISAGSSVVSGVVSLLGWIVMPVYLAFFLLMPRIHPAALSEAALPFFKPQTRADALYLGQEFVNLIVVFFRGQLIIALLQGMLFAIGFSLAGLQYGLVLGLMLGFLNIIPYLGNMVGLAVCLPLAWFQPDGGPLVLGLVIGVFALVQAIEGYFLTPKIMGDRTGLNPLVIIVAIFFWGSALDGILGMILAIPLTAFLAVWWRLARERYIAELF